METKQVALALLIISLILSGIALATMISAPDSNDFQPVDCARQVDCRLDDSVIRPAGTGGTIGFEITG